MFRPPKNFFLPTPLLSVAEYLTNLYEKMNDSAEITKKLDQEAKNKSKRWYEEKARERQFEVGESVLMLIPVLARKLEAAYSGPFTVLEKLSPVTYLIDAPGRGNKGRVVHVNLLKHWHTPTANILAVSAIPEGWTDDEGEIVTVETTESSDLPTGEDLSLEQKAEVKKLAQEFQDVFCSIPGNTDLEFHEIRTGDNRPIRLPPYRIPVAYADPVR